MDVELGTFRILGLVAHEIPVPSSEEPALRPTLSEVETPLQPGWKNYFRERISESLDRSFEVEVAPDIPSPVPGLLNDYFTSNTRFLQMSQGLATHLFASQSRRNPPGLLVVIRGQVDRDGTAVRALAVLKLEKEAGIRATQTNHEGKRTFAIEHLNDLLLTGKTKVFKAALFHESSTELFCSHVSDNQLGYQPTTEIAAFFLRFLGCKSRNDAQIGTKRFFQSTEMFINSIVQDPRNRPRYFSALLVELQSEKRLIVPAEFAQDHLALRDRAKYLDHLAASGLKDRSFVKDVALVKGFMGQTEIKLTNDIIVSGPPGSFDRLVHLSTSEDGKTRIEIEGEVAKVGGRGRRKVGLTRPPATRVSKANPRSRKHGRK